MVMTMQRSPLERSDRILFLPLVVPTVWMKKRSLHPNCGLWHSPKNWFQFEENKTSSNWSSPQNPPHLHSPNDKIRLIFSAKMTKSKKSTNSSSSSQQKWQLVNLCKDRRLPLATPTLYLLGKLILPFIIVGIIVIIIIIMNHDQKHHLHIHKSHFLLRRSISPASSDCLPL